MQMNVYTLNIYDSETKYIKYRQNIEGNDSFRLRKCEIFLSSLAPLARIFIEFPQCYCFVGILSFIVPYHK